MSQVAKKKKIWRPEPPLSKEEKFLQNFFHLDADDGYTIRLEIWSNKEPCETWESQELIHPLELNDRHIAKTRERLEKFLSVYKKKPLNGGISKK